MKAASTEVVWIGVSPSRSLHRWDRSLTAVRGAGVETGTPSGSALSWRLASPSCWLRQVHVSQQVSAQTGYFPDCSGDGAVFKLNSAQSQ